MITHPARFNNTCIVPAARYHSAQQYSRTAHVSLCCCKLPIILRELVIVVVVINPVNIVDYNRGEVLVFNISICSKIGYVCVHSVFGFTLRYIMWGGNNISIII